jgi:Fe-S cluster assembly protein SufD
LSFTAEASSRLGGPKWLARRRSEAWDRYIASDSPSGSQDLWKYSDVDEFDPGLFEPAPSEPEDRAAIDLARSRASEIGGRTALAVTLNGSLVHVEGPDGSSIEPGGDADVTVRHPEPDRELERVHVSRDAFDDLHWAFVGDTVEIDIKAKVSVVEPVVVVHVVRQPRQGSPRLPAAAFPHLYVRAGESAEAKVVEMFVGVSSEPLLVMPVTEVVVSENSHLRYATLQLLPHGHRHLGVQSARVDRDGSFHSFCASLGASVGRLRADADLVGQGGEAVLVAGYLGTGDQLHDLRTIQDHHAPRTSSRLLCMGAVADTARSAYVGLTRVRNGAHGADAYQTNHNLVLSEGAHADSVPNLDIQENDVRCSHASTVGPVDEDQLYYLETRGISPENAERLIVLGFFRDLAARAPVPAVGRYFEESCKKVLAEDHG